MEASSSSGKSNKKAYQGEVSHCGNCKVLGSALQIQTSKIEQLEQQVTMLRQKESEIHEVCMEIAQQATRQLEQKQQDAQRTAEALKTQNSSLSEEIMALKAEVAAKEQKINKF